MTQPLAQMLLKLRPLIARLVPFADAASEGLPMGRLIRLSLFQVSVGMATVLLIGTLNRVMIVEMGMAASLVSVMVALPLLFSPFRTLVGFRSDHHRSAFGVRRVPYIWYGTLAQFAGLAVMPFALLLLTGDHDSPAWIGYAAASVSFFLTGAGLQTTQTAGLALATDLAPPQLRPRVVALMYTMLLIGMVACGALFALLLQDMTAMRLIQVVQGAAVATLALNLAALWKQEARDRDRAREMMARGADPAHREPSFRETWARFSGAGRARRFLLALACGTAAFNMQDIVLEPYGGEILKLSVSETTALTAMMAIGSLAAFALAARLLMRGADPARLAANGAVAGLFAFACVVMAAPLEAPMLFRAGVALIGFGGGLFSVGTLTAAMALERESGTGLALGAWGAVQALSMGLAIGLGGVLRDAVSHLAQQGVFGQALAHPLTGYTAVYHIELMLLFVTLAVIGPLVGRSEPRREPAKPVFGLAEFPG